MMTMTKDTRRTTMKKTRTTKKKRSNTRCDCWKKKKTVKTRRRKHPRRKRNGTKFSNSLRTSARARNSTWTNERALVENIRKRFQRLARILAKEIMPKIRDFPKRHRSCESYANKAPKRCSYRRTNFWWARRRERSWWIEKTTTTSSMVRSMKTKVARNFNARGKSTKMKTNETKRSRRNWETFRKVCSANSTMEIKKKKSE